MGREVNCACWRVVWLIGKEGRDRVIGGAWCRLEVSQLLFEPLQPALISGRLLFQVVVCFLGCFR